MNAVGIDVSKGKSMVTILRPFGEIVSSPFEIKHTSSDIHSLIKLIHSIEGESRVVMEHTGRTQGVIMKSSLISFQRQIFSSVPLTQNLSRILIMIPFVKSNPTKLTLLRLHDMHLTSGKILNSIVLWMNYAINLKP